MIGEPMLPEVFRVVRGPDTKWVRYTNQASSWMDWEVCQKWFDEVFVPHVRATCTGKVLLLWDNCSGHKIHNPHADIEVLELPPNVTSRFQPLDGGIIVAVKRRYKRAMMQKLVDSIDNWDVLQRRMNWVRKGCAGLAHGHQAHMLDTADLVLDVWSLFD